MLLVPPNGKCTAHAFRIHPGEPLKQSLLDVVSVIFARQGSKSGSAFVLTAVGSVCDITLRLANAQKKTISRSEGENNNKITNEPVEEDNKVERANDIRRWQNHRFEIVSLTGTFSKYGDSSASSIPGCHLHISLSDKDGNTIGGHLIEGEIFTTLEIVIGTIDGVDFSRELDDTTGYSELVTKQQSQDKIDQNDDAIFFLPWNNAKVTKRHLAMCFILSSTFILSSFRPRKK